MTETWLPIIGSEGYWVSDQGRVRSVWKILKPWLVSNNGDRQGNLVVGLGRARREKVAVLVLEAFVGPRPRGKIARHLNDDPWNNRPSNLRWGTHSQNAHDAVRNERHGMSTRTHCPKGHLYDAVWSGKRCCKTCHRERTRDYKKRKRTGGQIKPVGRPKGS